MIRHSFGAINYLLHWTLDERVLKKLKGTGFDTLRGFHKKIRLNIPLLSVLIKRYNTDTRSFTLGSAENPFTITFGLEDVLYLTGLPIDGKAVTGVDIADGWSVCQQYLGKHEGYGKQSYISLKWLKDNFMIVDEKLGEEDEELLAYHVRAYVMYVIGCTFAPGSSLSVSSMFLPLLENVDDIGSYAWGAALLANIHDSIRCSRENPTKHLFAFYFPLMVFAYMRFPGLLSTFTIDRTKINEFPLLVSWSHALCAVMRDNNKNRNKEDLETFFDNLKEEEVKWQPYAEFSRNFLPQHLRELVVLAKSRTILICFEKAVYHRPDKCQRQLGLAGHVLEGELIKIETKLRKGIKEKNGTDWSKKRKYADYISEWDKRFDLLIDRDANAAHDETEVLVTNGDENVATDLAEASVNDANAALGLTESFVADNVFLEANAVLDNQDPERVLVIEDETSVIALLRKENEKLKEEIQLRKENEKLKEEIELYRKKIPENVKRISCTQESRADLVEKNDSRADDDHHSPGDGITSSRVRNSTEIRTCHPPKKAVERAEPVIIVIDSDSDSGDDVSITDSFLTGLLEAKKSKSND